MDEVTRTRGERPWARTAWRKHAAELWPDPYPLWLVILEVVLSVGAVLACLGSLLMTALGVAVLATNGAAIDQAGTTLEDWLSLAFFACLTVILVIGTVSWVRSLLAAEPEDDPDHEPFGT